MAQIRDIVSSATKAHLATAMAARFKTAVATLGRKNISLGVAARANMVVAATQRYVPREQLFRVIEKARYNAMLEREIARAAKRANPPLDQALTNALQEVRRA